MRAKDRSNLIKTGIFVTGLVAVMMVFVVSMGKESGLFEGKAMIRARVKNAEKLKTGAQVELKGLRIGFVEEIQIVSHDVVEILLKVRKDDVRWIKKDSKVEINNAGLVGDKYLEITAGSEDAGVLDPEKDILGGEEGMDFKAIAAKGTAIAATTESVLAKADALMGAIDGRRINETLDNFSRASKNMIPATEKMDKAMGRINSALERLDAVLARVQNGPGSAHGLIYDDSVHEDLRKLLGGAERNTVIKYFIRESIKKAPPKGN